MNKPLRVAIAGCHRMLLPKLTNHNFAAAFNTVALITATGIEMVAVFDHGAETRAEFLTHWGEMPTYDDYELMLHDVKPDIVCIATRQTMHADQIELAAAAGVRGILCDKPLATSLTEADRISAACQLHNVALLFGLDRRHLKPYQQLRQMIADGVVGEVKSMIAHGLPNLINHGCHNYDTALMLLSDPEPIWASGLVDDVADEPPDSRRRLDPSGRGMVGLGPIDPGGGVVITFSGDGGKKPSFEIIGEEGRLIILDDANEVYLWSKSEERAPGMTPLDLPPHEENWPAGPAMVANLVNAIKTGTPTLFDFDKDRRATEIGFALHLSHQNGCVRLPLPASDRTLSIPSFPWGNE